MEFLSKISELFSGRKQLISLDNAGAWESYGWNLSRRNTRITYDKDSAFTAYRAHELVYACINKISDVMNDAEIIVEEKSANGEWKKKEGHLLTSLFRRPNRNQTGRDLRRLLVQSEQSIGRFYAVMNRSAAQLPVELSVLNPNRVRTVFDRNKEQITEYEYTRKDGRRVLIKPEDMLIRRRPDLLDQFYGFAPLEAALKSINSDLGFTDYVDAFFESDGTPSGILKILNSTVSDTKKEALQANWKRNYSRGGKNQKGVAVLDQNADFQKIGSNLNELASDELSGRFESRICAVFGVPPNLVGAYVGLLHVTANATAKAELRNFWENKISGELAALREWMTWFLLPEFEPIERVQAEQVRVNFDIGQVAFLQEDLKDIHQRARENFKSGGITLNEFREAIGKKPDPEGDYYLQPLNLLSISPENRALEASQKVEQGKQPPADTGTATDKQPKTLEKKTFDLDGLIVGREPRGVELLIDLKGISDDLETEKEKAAKILSRFRKDLIDQAAKSIDGLDPEDVYKLTLAPDAEKRKQIRNTLASAYRRGRREIVAELNAQRAEKALPVLEFKDDLDDEDFLSELADLTISKLINEIQTRAINAYTLLRMLLDYTVDKLKERLLGESDKWVEQLAGNIANASIRTGRDAEIENNLDEIDHCEYSAILDTNTCPPCADADGQTAPTPADLPDAPNPDCEGGANCRCFIVGVIV
jgi:HK97 family phage portal protein